jgi:hypothetical protein
LLTEHLFLLLGWVGMIVMFEHPVFQDLDSCPWEPSSGSALLRTKISTLIVDGSTVTESPHLFPAGHTTPLLDVIFAHTI